MEDGLGKVTDKASGVDCCLLRHFKREKMAKREQEEHRKKKREAKAARIQSKAQAPPEAAPVRKPSQAMTPAAIYTDPREPRKVDRKQCSSLSNAAPRRSRSDPKPLSKPRAVDQAERDPLLPASPAGKL